MRPFEEDLLSLKAKLQEMGSLVANSVHKAVRSLVEQNSDYAHQVLRDEARVNQLEIQIDDLATTLIAREQPVARDMRLVVAAIKINGELERMGDLAVHTVERALSLMREEHIIATDGLEKIGSMVQQMVLNSLDAFVNEDSIKATQILTADDNVDEVRNAITEELVESMANSNGVQAIIVRDLDILIAVRSLERIADHATNVAEEVIFLVEGIDIRHRGTKEEEKV